MLIRGTVTCSCPRPDYTNPILKPQTGCCNTTWAMAPRALFQALPRANSSNKGNLLPSKCLASIASKRMMAGTLLTVMKGITPHTERISHVEESSRSP